MNKQQILSHVSDIPADVLFDFIRQGHVTLDELMKTGSLTPEKRRDLEIKLRNLEIEEDSMWENCRNSDNETMLMGYLNNYPAGKYVQAAKDKIREIREKIEDEEWELLKYTDDISALEKFIVKYPKGRYVGEAKKRIDELIKRKEEEERIRREIMNNIRADRNHYTPGRIQHFLREEVISINDLRCCNIPEDIISKVQTSMLLEINLGHEPDYIPDGFTEVYFWGIPSSGKTCALAAILNTAEKLGYMQIGRGTGTGYMFALKNLFKTEDNIGFLPEATADRTQYLPFALKKMNEKYSRSLSLIELSGEVFKCFARKYISYDDSLDDIEDTFATLDRFLLNTRNRKIHFFFIDYNPSYVALDQYTQSDYLNGAVSYFEEKKIFTKSTDAIFVIITKSDLIDGYHSDNNKLVAEINRYLEDNFRAFDHYLTNICKRLSINGGRPIILPFSIGDVYFKRICRLRRNRSEKILECLFDRIRPQKETIFGKLLKT